MSFAQCLVCLTWHEEELLEVACPECAWRAQEAEHEGDLWRVEGLGLAARVMRAGQPSSLEDALERLNFLERQLELAEGP